MDLRQKNMVTMITDKGLEDRIMETDGLLAVAFLDYESIPCDHFRSELDAAANKLDGKVKFCQIDISENPSITEELLIEMVPTLLLFRDGGEIARFEGPYSREMLCERITQLEAKRG